MLSSLFVDCSPVQVLSESCLLVHGIWVDRVLFLWLAMTGWLMLVDRTIVRVLWEHSIEVWLIGRTVLCSQMPRVDLDVVTEQIQLTTAVGTPVAELISAAQPDPLVLSAFLAFPPMHPAPNLPRAVPIFSGPLCLMGSVLLPFVELSDVDHSSPP